MLDKSYITLSASNLKTHYVSARDLSRTEAGDYLSSPSLGIKNRKSEQAEEEGFWNGWSLHTKPDIRQILSWLKLYICMAMPKEDALSTPWVKLE